VVSIEDVCHHLSLQSKVSGINGDSNVSSVSGEVVGFSILENREQAEAAVINRVLQMLKNSAINLFNM